MAAIHFAIIALKKKEPDFVIQELKEHNLDEIAEWMNEKKGTLYGDLSEDWKPFNGKTVSEILKDLHPEYVDATILIDQIDAKFTNIAILLGSNIRIYFIDIFTLFIHHYQELAKRLDFSMAENNTACLVMPYGLSSDSDHLVTNYSQALPLVTAAYSKGFQHRLLMRTDDLQNVANYLFNSIHTDDQPSLVNQRIASQELGVTTYKPTF